MEGNFFGDELCACGIAGCVTHLYYRLYLELKTTPVRFQKPYRFIYRCSIKFRTPKWVTQQAMLWNA